MVEGKQQELIREIEGPRHNSFRMHPHLSSSVHPLSPPSGKYMYFQCVHRGELWEVGTPGPSSFRANSPPPSLSILSKAPGTQAMCTQCIPGSSLNELYSFCFPFSVMFSGKFSVLSSECLSSTTHTLAYKLRL